MNKTALLALCLAIVLPVGSYLVVKYYSNTAIDMPRRYYPDSISTKVVDGKEITDTIWHKVSNISLTNQLGDIVSLNDDLKGKVIVADFFFTRCPTICPTLTRNMKKLQDALKRKSKEETGQYFVHFLSFSVDPERDSVTVLKKYADRFGVNSGVWWLLTGPKKDIYDFALNELKLGLQDGEGVDSNFIHTSKFTLLDKDRVVRGYYDGLDSAAMNKLAQDIVFIMLEKDKKKKRDLFRK